jgi:alkane 1-monooxygenase
MKKELRWKVPLWTYCVVDWLALFWFLNIVLTRELNWIQWAFLMFTVGNFATGGINLSHECMHKRDTVSRMIGWFHLLKNFYMHFVIEHTRGHHKRVATPEDPASA